MTKTKNKAANACMIQRIGSSQNSNEAKGKCQNILMQFHLDRAQKNDDRSDIEQRPSVLNNFFKLLVP